MGRSKSYNIPRNTLLKTGRLSPCPVHEIHNPYGLILLAKLRLDLSHLNGHNFNHNFLNCLNPLCNYSL